MRFSRFQILFHKKKLIDEFNTCHKMLPMLYLEYRCTLELYFNILTKDDTTLYFNIMTKDDTYSMRNHISKFKQNDCKKKHLNSSIKSLLKKIS